MDIYQLKFTRLQQEIFRLFCVRTGESLNQRQIALELKVTPTAVAKALPLLEKERLITVKKGTTNTVELCRDLPRTMELKRIENLKLLVESGLPLFLEEKLPGCTIVLFGSYARGDDLYSSDIDIAVIGSSDKNLDLRPYERKLQKEIRVNYYANQKNIQRHLLANLWNGYLLAGGFEA